MYEAITEDNLISGESDTKSETVNDGTTKVEPSPEIGDAREDSPVLLDNYNNDEVDYEEIIASDLAVLRSEFAELKNLGDITDLDNPLRYAELRDLGLDPREAYLATAKRTRRDNRSHLTTAYGRNAVTPIGSMSQRELSEAREIFNNLSDSEIQRLYRKVTS